MGFGAAALGMIQSIRYNKAQKELRRGRQQARREAGAEALPPPERRFNREAFPAATPAQRAASVARVRRQRRAARCSLALKVVLAVAGLFALGYAYHRFGGAVCYIC